MENKYTNKEDLANAISHGVSAIFSVFALIYLIIFSVNNGTGLDVFAYTFYGVTLLLMFTMSSVYHSIRNQRVKKIFRKLDHSVIYLLILGTYTPFVFSVLNNSFAYKVYIVLSVITVLGIIFKAFFVDKIKILSTLLYVIMGWQCIMLIRQLLESLPSESIIFLVIGGVIYTLGALFYAFSKFKFHHLVWHIFVLLGAMAHFISITYIVL